MPVNAVHDTPVRGEDFVLPRGVTGFRHVREPPLPVSDFRSFVRTCHAVARLVSGEVLASAAADQRQPANFRIVTLRLPERTVDVLVNAVHSIVGITRPLDPTAGALVFVDEPEIVAAFVGARAWRLLSKSALDCPVQPEAVVELAPAERNQISYWKPRRIGDVIVNHWD